MPSLCHAAAGGGCSGQRHVPGTGRAHGDGTTQEEPQNHPQTPPFAEPRPIASTGIPSLGCPVRRCQPSTEHRDGERDADREHLYGLKHMRVPPQPLLSQGLRSLSKDLV